MTPFYYTVMLVAKGELLPNPEGDYSGDMSGAEPSVHVRDVQTALAVAEALLAPWRYLHATGQDPNNGAVEVLIFKVTLTSVITSACQAEMIKRVRL